MQAEPISSEQRAQFQAKIQAEIRNQKYYVATRFGTVLEAKYAHNDSSTVQAEHRYICQPLGSYPLIVGGAFQVHRSENVFTNREWAVERAAERLKKGK